MSKYCVPKIEKIGTVVFALWLKYARNSLFSYFSMDCLRKKWFLKEKFVKAFFFVFLMTIKKSGNFFLLCTGATVHMGGSASRRKTWPLRKKFIEAFLFLLDIQAKVILWLFPLSCIETIVHMGGSASGRKTLSLGKIFTKTVLFLLDVQAKVILWIFPLSCTETTVHMGGPVPNEKCDI